MLCRSTPPYVIYPTPRRMKISTYANSETNTILEQIKRGLVW